MAKKSTKLHCILDDCPKDKRSVDWRTCEGCNLRTGENESGVIECTHPEAKSNPDISRMDAIRASAGCQHLLQCGPRRKK